MKRWRQTYQNKDARVIECFQRAFWSQKPFTNIKAINVSFSIIFPWLVLLLFCCIKFFVNVFLINKIIKQQIADTKAMKPLKYILSLWTSSYCEIRFSIHEFMIIFHNWSSFCNTYISYAFENKSQNDIYKDFFGFLTIHFHNNFFTFGASFVCWTKRRQKIIMYYVFCFLYF